MDKTKLSEIFTKIKEYKKIIIFPHARPDGDCIGTSFGLKNIIETSWPDKTVIVAGETSDFTSFLGRPETLKDEDFKGALAISVDTANNVGIGNTTPAYKLDVAGNVYAGNNSFLLSTYNSVGLSQFIGKEYIGRIIAGMEIENTTLGGNWSQKINFNTNFTSFGLNQEQPYGIEYRQPCSSTLKIYQFLKVHI